MGFFEKIKAGTEQDRQLDQQRVHRVGAGRRFLRRPRRAADPRRSRHGHDGQGRGAAAPRGARPEDQDRGGGARGAARGAVRHAGRGRQRAESRPQSRRSCWSSASTASARRRRSASSQISSIRQGKKVLLCAADTFRARGGRSARDLGRVAPMSTSSARARAPTRPPVVFDAISAAKARGADVILCDTAGRLHNKANLMNELGKIRRIIDRELPDADEGGPARARRHDGPERPAAGQAVPGDRGR